MPSLQSGGIFESLNTLESIVIRVVQRDLKMTSFDTLPAEIMQQIIRYLDVPPPISGPLEFTSQPAPLKRLSQVCKTFRAEIFHNLFNQLQIQQHFTERRIMPNQKEEVKALLGFIKQYHLQFQSTTMTLRAFIHRNSSYKHHIIEGAYKLKDSLVKD